MFYFSLVNQIHLLIIVLFSSYIYMSSFSVKPDTPFIKHFGTAFFIPLTLSIMSFLSLNQEFSSSYLFFAEFILITAVLVILLFEKNRDFTYILFVLLYALPLIIGIVNLNFNSLNRSSVFYLILSIYLGIIITIMISCTLIKQYSRIPLYWGLAAVCASLLIARLSPSAGTASTLALLLKAAGYALFSCFFYRSTFRKLKEAHSRNTAQLERINQSVQREVSRRVEEIERSNKKLVEISKTDSLTGAYTKKAIMDMMDNLASKRPDTEFSILLFDIDNFKGINDTHGHITGDKCIKSLVSIARASLRNDDRLGRFGGDKFIILLPGTSPVKAYLAADRFRKNVEGSTSDPHFTISIGVASYPLDAKNAGGLIHAADKALYASKQKGRNRVTHTGQLEDKNG